VGEPQVARVVLHVDLDAFFVSVERRRQAPELREQPLIVGSPGPRGVVLCASYDARALGVHAGQPVSRARRLCPRALVLPPDHQEYGLASRGVMESLFALARAVEPAGLDEAYLDVSGSGIHEDPTALAHRIRARIAEEQELSCSVGIGPNKLVAKLASAAAKPDARGGGILAVDAREVGEFLRPLAARALPGIGPRTAELLDRYGLRTVADLADTAPETLRRLLGHAAGTRLSRYARGVDERAVIPYRRERSIGAERTFPADTDDPEAIGRVLLALAGECAGRLRAEGLTARTVVLKLNLSSRAPGGATAAARTASPGRGDADADAGAGAAPGGGRALSRSRTLPVPVDLSREIHAHALELYRGLRLVRPRVRLVGIRLEGLAPAGPRQLSLGGFGGFGGFGPGAEGGEGGAGAAGNAADRAEDWRAVERTLDKVADRFGPAAVRPATLLPADRERRGPAA